MRTSITFWGNSVYSCTNASPELKKLEEEKEKRRYRRLKMTIETILEDKTLLPEYSHQTARDVLWALTGRDMYRLLVVERKWHPQGYEEWLVDPAKGSF